MKVGLTHKLEEQGHHSRVGSRDLIDGVRNMLFHRVPVGLLLFQDKSTELASGSPMRP